MYIRQLCIFFLFLITLSIHAYGNSDKDIPFPIDNDYLNYSYSFEPLTGNEQLTYEYEKKELTVFAKNQEGELRWLGNWTNVYWGSIRFSQDRTKMFFGNYSKGYYYPLFILDGHEGNVDYLFDTTQLLIIDGSLSYLLGFDYDYYNEIKNIESSDGSFTYRFVLIDLERDCLKRYVYWKIDRKRPGGGITLLRSLDAKFDFHILFEVEQTVWAEAYYNIESEKVEITMDDTNLENWRPHSYDKTDEERGFYPPE